jgi:hypothetical protein
MATPNDFDRKFGESRKRRKPSPVAPKPIPTVEASDSESDESAMVLSDQFAPNWFSAIPTTSDTGKLDEEMGHNSW